MTNDWKDTSIFSCSACLKWRTHYYECKVTHRSHFASTVCPLMRFKAIMPLWITRVMIIAHPEWWDLGLTPAHLECCLFCQPRTQSVPKMHSCFARLNCSKLLGMQISVTQTEDLANYVTCALGKAGITLLCEGMALFHIHLRALAGSRSRTAIPFCFLMSTLIMYFVNMPTIIKANKKTDHLCTCDVYL